MTASESPSISSARVRGVSLSATYSRLRDNARPEEIILSLSKDAIMVRQAHHDRLKNLAVNGAPVALDERMALRNPMAICA